MTLLDVQDLRVAYGDRIAIDGVSLRVDRPEMIAVLGPNGSGKTTLLRALLGLAASTGHIAWQGSTDLIDAPARLAKVAAYLAQSPTAIAGQTVAQAIQAGRFAHRGAFEFFDSVGDAAIVREVAGGLALTDLLDRSIDALSGGQRQRVFLARCLAQRTPALVLDEPASFLDLRHQLELHRTLADQVRREGKTVLIAGHDLNLAARHCDRMLLLADGKLIADGPPDAIMDPALIERVFGVPMRRLDVDGRPHLMPA